MRNSWKLLAKSINAIATISLSRYGNLIIKDKPTKQILFISKRIINNHSIRISVHCYAIHVVMWFWYYSAFCAIYKHSQYQLVVICFVFNIILSMIFAIIVALLRLSCIKYKSETVYKITNTINYIH